MQGAGEYAGGSTIQNHILAHLCFVIEHQTSGFGGAIFKSFKTRGEAESYIRSNSSSASSAPPSASNTKTASAGQKRARDHGDNVSTTQQKKTAIQKRNASSTSNSSNAELQITIHFDGGSRGNPGLAGAGAQVVVVKANDNATTTYSIREFVGNRATNNYAEYKGLIAGLKQAKLCIEQYEASSQLQTTMPLFKLQVYGDSNLIIQQLRGAWQCKHPNILPLFHQSQQLLGEMKSIDGRGQVLLDHVYRDQNKVADGKLLHSRLLTEICRNEFILYPNHCPLWWVLMK